MVGYRFLMAMVAATGLVVAGCGGSSTTVEKPGGTGGDEHADHEHEHADPETLTEAVAVLTEIRDELAEAYKTADVKTVDQIWHEMWPVAKKAKELAASSNLDQYEEKDADAAASQIIEILEELHPPHGADAKVDPKAYEDQADSLNDAINNLKKIADKTKPAE